MHGEQNISRFGVFKHSRRDSSHDKERSRGGGERGDRARLRPVDRAALVKLAREFRAHGITAQNAHAPDISAAAGYVVKERSGSPKERSRLLRAAEAGDQPGKEEKGKERGRHLCPEKFKPVESA